MAWILALMCVAGVGLALGGPARRSLQEVDNFRQYLQETRTNEGSSLLRVSAPAAAAINAEELSGKYQGDIILDQFQIDSMTEEFAAGRNAYTWPNTKWPNDTVVWEFAEGEFGPLQSAAIVEAIEDIEKNTCIKFRPRKPEDTAYVSLTGFSDGCYAHVGYWETRGVHTLNLARNTPGVACFRHATIVHEWMHILGFLHMQSTWNRDEYVRIATENLIPGTEHNFDIYNENLVNNMDVEYDYVSCLHYGPYGFTINGLPTIVALQEHDGTMGQRDYITDKDWLRINRHYNCPGAWH